jgi:transposase
MIGNDIATSPHKVAGVREATGAKLRYLPKYSPDLNPIEQAFQQIQGASPKSSRTSKR